MSETSKINSDSDTDSENQVSLPSISRSESERNNQDVQTDRHTKGSDQVFDSANGNGTSGIKRGKPRRNISHVSFTENFLFP